MYLEFAELQTNFHTEQCLRTADQTAVQIHRHVTCLNRLNDIILLAFVPEFQVLLVETERCFGVVVEAEVQLVANLAVDGGLNLLIEIEDVIVTRTLGQRWVVDVLVLESEQQLCRTLHLQLHTAGTEHLVCGTDIELHVRYIKLPLVAVFHLAYLLLPVAVHLLALAVLQILVLIEHVRRGDVHIAYLRVDDVIAVVGVVLNLCSLSVLKLYRTTYGAIALGCRKSGIGRRIAGCGFVGGGSRCGGRSSRPVDVGIVGVFVVFIFLGILGVPVVSATLRGCWFRAALVCARRWCQPVGQLCPTRIAHQ